MVEESMERMISLIDDKLETIDLSSYLYLDDYEQGILLTWALK
jgi:hypothetical protein